MRLTSEQARELYEGRSSPIAHLQLLASPIPGAAPISELSIAQGELYRFTGASESIKSWISGLERRYCLFDSLQTQMEDCLCQTVLQDSSQHTSSS
jgi:hypothetical protein